jgi:hypothetical protein
MRASRHNMRAFPPYSRTSWNCKIGGESSGQNFIYILECRNFWIRNFRTLLPRWDQTKLGAPTGSYSRRPSTKILAFQMRVIRGLNLRLFITRIGNAS